MRTLARNKGTSKQCKRGGFNLLSTELFLMSPSQLTLSRVQTKNTKTYPFSGCFNYHLKTFLPVYFWMLMHSLQPMFFSPHSHTTPTVYCKRHQLLSHLCAVDHCLQDKTVTLVFNFTVYSIKADLCQHYECITKKPSWYFAQHHK